MLSLTHFTKRFKHKTVFEDFSLTLEAGEMVALTGPSGSGKTTLLNAIGLIEPIEQGQYHLFDQPAPAVNSRAAQRIIREKISYLFQNFALVDYFTVNDNLMMALKYVKESPAAKKQRIAEALTQVGLKDYEEAKVFEISGGEQQRVAIARAIIKPSELILADEPTGALDSQNRDDILQILQNINQSGKTLLVVTHDETVAAQCSRIIRLP